MFCSFSLQSAVPMDLTAIESINLDNDEDENDNRMDDDEEDELSRKRMKTSAKINPTHNHLSDVHIKIALSLYRVQPGIYLLDFQRLEVTNALQ
jgi:hypothetical protein